MMDRSDRKLKEQAGRILQGKITAVTSVLKANLDHFSKRLLEERLVAKGRYDLEDRVHTKLESATILYNDCMTAVEINHKKFSTVLNILREFPQLEEVVQEMEKEGVEAGLLEPRLDEAAPSIRGKRRRSTDRERQGHRKAQKSSCSIPISTVLPSTGGSQLELIKTQICQSIASEPPVLSRLADQLRCEELITPAAQSAVKFVDGRSPYDKADVMITPAIERVRNDLGRNAPALVRALTNVGLGSVTTVTCLTTAAERRTHMAPIARLEIPEESSSGSASASSFSSLPAAAERESPDTVTDVVDDGGGDGREKQLFLSYGREPEVKSFVIQLKHDLERRGFTVWLDIEDIPAGCDWRAAIGSGLHHCKGLIAVITNKYIKSKYCANELYVADSDEKCIFPVIFEDVQFEKSEKSRGVRYVINGINWCFFRPEVDNYESSLSKLMKGMTEKGIGPSAVEDVDCFSDNSAADPCGHRKRTRSSNDEEADTKDKRTREITKENGPGKSSETCRDSAPKPSSSSSSPQDKQAPNIGLVIEDLNTLFKLMKDVADKWKLIGLELHLCEPALKKLAANNLGKDQHEHLLSMLGLWLRQNYNTEKFGEPTWRMLVSALKEVEDCKPIAEDILNKKPWQQ